MPPQQRPPVPQSAVAAPTRRNPSTAEANYLTIVETLKANQGADAKAMRMMFGGSKALVDRFLSVAFSLLARENDLLQNATPMSIIEAIKTAASMGLEPMTDDGVIVHHKGIAVFRPMYRGYLKRIRNSGKVVDVDCQVVYENDVFEVTLGTDPSIRHIPTYAVKDDEGKLAQERGGYRAVYAWALMPSGLKIIEVMEEAEINYIRDTFASTHSRDGRPLPWATSYGEMSRKTVIRRLAKRLPAAAVDQLLQADAVADEAERALKSETNAHMEDLRRLALHAVTAANPTAALAAGEAGNSVDGAAPEGDDQAPVEEAKPADDPMAPLLQEPMPTNDHEAVWGELKP